MAITKTKTTQNTNKTPLNLLLPFILMALLIIIITLSKTANVNLSTKAYTNASYHESKSSMLFGLFKDRSVDSKTALKQKGVNANANSQISLNGKNVNITGSSVKVGNGNVFITADENVNIMDATERTSTTKIREHRGLSFGLSGGRLTFAKETKDHKTVIKESAKASNIEAKGISIKSGSDTNVIASNIKAGALKVDAGNDFNVLSDKTNTYTKEMHSKKEIGIELTANSKEVSLFAGYWEDKKGKKSSSSNVVSSNIMAGKMEVNSKNTNIKGSNVVGEDIAIHSDNIRVLDDSTNTQTDSYVKHIKAGVQVGVKQHLSDTINSVKSVAKAKSVSGAVASGAKAYDAVSNFSKHPVSAGVEAIYQSNSSNTKEINSQSVGSKLIASKHLTLDAKNKLEIKGSDVGSNDKLDVTAKTIQMSAGENHYSVDTKTQNKSASIELYGTKMGQASFNYNKSNMHTQGVVHKNATLFAKGKGSIHTTGDVTLKGANINAGDLDMKVGGKLTMQSLQDTQTIKGKSKGAGLNTAGLSISGVSASKGSTEGKRAWVGTVTSINGQNSANIEVNGQTTLKGASITSIDKDGKDTNKLNFKTKSLVTENIKDIDNFKSTNGGVNIGLGGKSPTINSVNYAKNTKTKEQITKATISNGKVTINNKETKDVQANRDINNIQTITKDKSSNEEIYLSQNTLALAKDPTKELHKLKQNLNDVGLASHVEIVENLPSATKGKDGEGDFIDNTIGKVLDKAGNSVPLGIIPTAQNDGGYVTQIATQLFGDNRAGIVTHDKSKLDALGLRERQPGDKAKDWDYEKVTFVKTKDGIKPISEVKDTTGLEVITTYRTNPDKKLVIEDGKDRSGNSALEGYKIRVKAEDIKKMGIDHVFTNGMFNSHDTAVWNQQTQQGFSDGILNYNQQHGIIGDLLEDAQDHITVNGLDIIREVSTLGKADGAVDGIGFLGTGGSRQTGELISQMTTITNGNLVVGAHSQGTMMTENGLDQYQNEISQVVQSNKNSQFLMQYSGAPVNHVIAENKIREIYGGDNGIKEHIGKKNISNVFRSNVTPGDFVGSVLGYQGAGINNSENVGKAMVEGVIGVPRLFGYGDPSPHSYYPCVIGCGNEKFTPDIGKYYTPNKFDEKGKPQSPIQDYYKENFEVARDDGTKEMTIDTSLLPTYNSNNNGNKKVNLKNLLPQKDKR